MGGIFISYRREDSAGHAGRLFDRLGQRFGKHAVFMDVSGIEPGTDFIESIERALDACDVMVLTIGSAWLHAAGGGRRLDDPSDLVRIEVATALRRNVAVIPVLIRGATMPRAEELPDELKPLARRQAVELSDTGWESDVARLEDAVARRLQDAPSGKGASTPAPGPAARGPRRWAVATALIALTASLVSITAWLRSGGERARSPATETSDARRDDGGGVAGGLSPKAEAEAIALPEVATVKVSGQEYELLGIRRERQDADHDALVILVRMTNTGRNPANFWDSSFRLLLGDQAQAPVSGLDELTAAHAAADGELRFTIPRAIDSVRLQITNGKDSTAIPLDLARRRPTASEGSADAFGRPRKPSLASTVTHFPLDLPAGSEVITGDVTYKILAVQLARYNVEQAELRFTIRCLNRGHNDVNFWSSTFRLILDGVARAPISDLDELVAAGTSKEATVSFLIDERPEAVVLRIHDGSASDVPIDLGAAR